MAKSENRRIYLTFFMIMLLFAACKSALKEAPILLFDGTGTSPNDVEAIKDILASNHLDFVTVDSDQLNELDTNRLKKYKLIIIPGGNFIEMGKGLTPKTANTIQKSVHQGLNYLGICAGGFLAGNTRNNSFNIAKGVQFKFYSAEYKGIRKAAVAVINADGATIEHYWEDGPEFSSWGNVVSKYPDGTPATVQGNYGSGWVVLTGVHPEAPEKWRKEFYFSTAIESSHNYAVGLIMAAMEKKAMPHF
ncbi:BPL-N domain-containing protein [Runella sp.]|uniref:BPL-N domain-containing protein n=1 Tax=Runella sp. TaxID=1960881 RepID=UPI003D117F11